MRTPSTGKANLTLWTGRLLFLFELSLSVPISAAIEDATGFATPGPLLARYIVGTTGLQGLGALIVCGIGIDATLCCGMIWGLHVLGHSWMQFRRGQPHWSHSTQRANVLFAAILCGPFFIVLRRIFGGEGTPVRFVRTGIIFYQYGVGKFRHLRGRRVHGICSRGQTEARDFI